MPTAALNLCAGSAGVVACDVISMGTAGGTRVGGEEGHACTGAARAWACAALSEVGQARTSSGAARGNLTPAQRNATGCPKNQDNPQNWDIPQLTEAAWVLGASPPHTTEKR